MRNLMVILVGILTVLLLGLGSIAGYYFLTEGSRNTFTDTVLFVMALVGLLVVLASWGIWTGLKRILQEDISKQVSGVERTIRNEALSRMAVRVAHSFWMFYEETHDNVFRDQALEIIKEAREILEGREEVNKEELKCRIYNNLAFAYADRGETNDTGMAHFLISQIIKEIKDFPKREIEWLETYAYVLYRLPKKQDDKQKALDMVNELLERLDIKDEMKDQIRQRYPIPNAKAGHPTNPDDELNE